MSNNLMPNPIHGKLSILFPAIISLLLQSQLAYAVYESSEKEIPNFDIEDSHSNLALAQVEESKGKLTEALFALERAIAINPQNYDARLLLGDIYTKLGEKDAAKIQYQYIIDAQQKQSAAAQSALNGLKYVHEWSHKAIIGYRIGHNDNVNSGLDNTSVFIPSISTSLILPDSTRENNETTQTLYASGRAHYQHTDSLTYIIAGTASKTDDDFFNQRYAAIDLGARINHEKTQHSFRFIQSYVDYDNFDDINISRLKYDYLQHLRKKNYYQLAIGLQHLNYDKQDIRDDNRLTLSAKYRYFLAPTLHLTSEIFYTEDIKSENTFENIDFDAYGSKATLHKQLNNKVSLSLGLHYRINNYDGEDPLFLKERLDKRLQLRSKLSWELIHKTTLSLSYQYTDNNSNISLYDFDKNVFFIDIAKAF